MIFLIKYFLANENTRKKCLSFRRKNHSLPTRIVFTFRAHIEWNTRHLLPRCLFLEVSKKKKKYIWSSKIQVHSPCSSDVLLRGIERYNYVQIPTYTYVRLLCYIHDPATKTYGDRNTPLFHCIEIRRKGNPWEIKKNRIPKKLDAIS